MGRRKLKAKSKVGKSQLKKQNMDLDAPPSSSSSSSIVHQAEMSIQEPSRSTSEKIEDGQAGKKLKKGSKCESENYIEVENKCFMDQLPPEMSMKILKYLNVKSLAASRLVSRKWNGIAREIIKSRDDVETVFYCRKTVDGDFKLCGRTERATLENFIKWFEHSKESPLYTRFHFDGIEPSVFDHPDWTKFISSFGKGVKSLKLGIDYLKSDADLIILLKKVRNLLLNLLPNLQEFGLNFPSRNLQAWAFSNIKLFPARAIQLPQLKVLYLDADSFLKFTGLVSDLLQASINLQRIESFNMYSLYSKVETFELLQSLGKLHCLQSAQVHGFLTQVKSASLESAPFKLRKLRLDVSQIYKNEHLSLFLSNLFESSKDTLTKLEIDRIEFLPDLQLPKFSKLTNLIIQEGCEEKVQVLLTGLDLSEIFPRLQSLELCVAWTHFSPPDESHHQNTNFSCLPSLKSLKITSNRMTKEDVVRISQACPNLKEFQFCTHYFREVLKNFPEVGQAIWTGLTKLETLDLLIERPSTANAFPALDSCFTGFSRQVCTLLYKGLIMNSASQIQIKTLQSKLKVERKNPSILDLKDLRYLKVGFGHGKIPKDKLMVSEKYAFQLMENLTYKIEEY